MKIYFFIKRVLDIVFAIILLIVTSPIMLVAAIAIKLDSKGPVFFIQQRCGKNTNIINVCKFRTMSINTQYGGISISDIDRITRVGKVLRKTSIDELPQLCNILRGKMSFIGPRPLLVKFLPYYTEKEMKRHSVLPGITGWAQVNGRNTISWETKFKYDLEYIEKMSFTFDLKIVLLTIFKLFTMADVDNEGFLDLDIERKN